MTDDTKGSDRLFDKLDCQATAPTRQSSTTISINDLTANFNIQVEAKASHLDGSLDSEANRSKAHPVAGLNSAESSAVLLDEDGRDDDDDDYDDGHDGNDQGHDVSSLRESQNSFADSPSYLQDEEHPSYVDFDQVDKNNMFPHFSPPPEPWTAPPEPLRPRNPYGKGQELVIRRHTACPPFGQDYPDYPGLREAVDDKELRTKTLVEICLEHPPMAGEIADGPPQHLKITGEIRVKDDGGAQLVICHLGDKPEKFVAKIYDPLYYGFSDRTWPDQPRDVSDEADKDYCREVAAYLELDAQTGGTLTPKFHGSWTFQMPLDLPDGRRIRDVRMIIIEKIQGRTMVDVKPDPFPEPIRLDVMARIAEAFERLIFIGVHHGDLSQRNIMLCDGAEANTIGRIVIIDFNFGTIFRLDDFEEKYGPRPTNPGKPLSPLVQWWDGGLYGGFGEWLPATWEQRLRPMQEWLYERWGASEEYAPLERPLQWDEENVSRPWCTY